MFSAPRPSSVPTLGVQLCPMLQPLPFGPARPMCMFEDRLWAEGLALSTPDIACPGCTAAERTTHDACATPVLAKGAGGRLDCALKSLHLTITTLTSPTANTYGATKQGNEDTAYPSVSPGLPNRVFALAVYTFIASTWGSAVWAGVQAQRALTEEEDHADKAIQEIVLVICDEKPYTYKEIYNYNHTVNKLESEFKKNVRALTMAYLKVTMETLNLNSRGM
ncbi:hypothetical protein B0H17DRAFT_1176749 [Mycena rosella]|uniref:Uncharacterized protein n=1 Tax=Mycena rosella TaxID=1033263 RepID=A0AAD7DX40_MYCRO|nr:hypothetical protein B0H17DRAFT_1176749 [Mycena rosella]